MASRSRGRQFALQMIYQHLFTGEALEDVDRHFWRDTKSDATTRRFSLELAQGVLDHAAGLDLEISGYLQNWSLDRIAVIDRIILQLALYELTESRDVPWKVVIDEAVALAQTFSTDKSPTFVNGVLHAWSVNNGYLAGEDQGTAGEEASQPPAGDGPADGPG